MKKSKKLKILLFFFQETIMIKGSHNTMTYLKPDKFIFKLFKFMYQCQDKNLKKQYDEGIRCFDLRVKWKKDKWIFAHGYYYSSDTDLISVLNNLNAWAVMNQEKIYVRILLEASKYDKITEDKFADLCRNLKSKYSEHLIFFEGRRKYDWNILYDFGFYPNVIQYTGSMQKWWGKIWPVIYALFYNKKNMKKAEADSSDSIYLFDFI